MGGYQRGEPQEGMKSLAQRQLVAGATRVGRTAGGRVVAGAIPAGRQPYQLERHILLSSNLQESGGASTCTCVTR